MKWFVVVFFLIGSAQAATFVDTVRAGGNNVLFWKNTVTANDRGFDNPAVELDFGKNEFPASSGIFYTNDIGIRFTSTSQPAHGDICDSIQFSWMALYNSTGTPSVLFYGEKATNPSIFSDSTDFKARTKTTASYAYTFSAGSRTIGTRYTIGPNANLTAAYQEVLDGTAKTSSNPSSFIIVDNSSSAGQFESSDVFGNGITKAVIVTIWYHTPSGGSAGGSGTKRATQRTTQR